MGHKPLGALAGSLRDHLLLLRSYIGSQSQEMQQAVEMKIYKPSRIANENGIYKGLSSNDILACIVGFFLFLILTKNSVFQFGAIFIVLILGFTLVKVRAKYRVHYIRDYLSHLMVKYFFKGDYNLKNSYNSILPIFFVILLSLSGTLLILTFFREDLSKNLYVLLLFAIGTFIYLFYSFQKWIFK